MSFDTISVFLVFFVAFRMEIVTPGDVGDRTSRWECTGRGTEME